MNDSRALHPPGKTERVSARSCLVLAPHADDEVLGCGGLLAQLAATGAAVRVLFLTDSSGGVEEVADRPAYAARRRDEAARAAAVLGIAGADHLDLPDGNLAERLDDAERGIRRALFALRPELVLVPSPLELSADHRAAFAALHRVLAPLRGEDLAHLQVLAYEVNRPALPDLLVDVSAEVPRIEAAMAAYASQEERHGYLAAALGLRRFRTLTLPSGVPPLTPLTHVEGYRRLALADFTTRSPAQLVRWLGGDPQVLEVHEGPRISVVVRTKDRPRLLAEALASLAEGSYRRVEVVLVNDGGAPPAVPDGFQLPVVRVDLPENRGRAVAAQAGVTAATGDFVAFLDDDDLVAPEHLATLAGLVSGAGVAVAYTDAAVGIYELDEDGWACRERRLPYSRDFDPDVLAVDNYIPFNTLAIERRLFDEIGPFDASLPFFEDWDYLIRLAERMPFHHLARVTCEYRHFRGGAHHVFGERPRERADFLAVKARVLDKHAGRRGGESLARAIDTLRGEAVAARESVAFERRGREAAVAELGHRIEELRAAHDRLAVERALWEDRCHAARGESDARRQHVERLEAELARLYEEEQRLRAAVEEQTAHLGRTYGEIERLNGVVRGMEATRAWRVHRWLEGRRS